jgi:diguanylate cyclase (GGDEF)-like protein
MDQSLKEKISSCRNLPTLPTVALEVLEVTRHPDCDMKQVAAVINRDPALSARVLKTVNSSYYGRSQRVVSIDQALVVMGLQSVKTLVLGFSLVENLMNREPDGFDHVKYWRHSFFAACAAKEIAVQVRLMQTEEVFICGLLADIGMLVLDSVDHEAFAAACRLVTSHVEQADAERRTLSADHAEVGGFIADKWKLPPVLSEPILCHADPSQAEAGTLAKMASVVALASRCADVFVDAEPAQAIIDVRADLVVLGQQMECDLDAGAADDLLARLTKLVAEVAGNFEVDLGSANGFDRILRDANEALVEITLQSQQQAQDLQKQAADREAQFAQREAELKKQATTDGLTGLANRAEFDRFLAEELADAAGRGEPLALILCDIDRFKSVNDTHGHQVGDGVIVHLANLMEASCREDDCAARYGGEEMALVLPGIDRVTAAAVAEELRRTLAAEVVIVGETQLPVTASFGVAAFEPPSPLDKPKILINAADRALYHAKETGRDRVKVFSLPRPRAAA